MVRYDEEGGERAAAVKFGEVAEVVAEKRAGAVVAELEVIDNENHLPAVGEVDGLVGESGRDGREVFAAENRQTVPVIRGNKPRTDQLRDQAGREGEMGRQRRLAFRPGPKCVRRWPSGLFPRAMVLRT